MRRVWGLAALSAAVLLPFGGAAGQGPAATSRDILPTGAVTALSVMPGSGRADVTIGVNGAVEVLDFTLENPPRVVVDLKGATLGLPVSLYDKVSRGGITNVLFSQWKSDVVRVALYLDNKRDYTVIRGDKDVKISVAGSDAFVPWQAGKTSKALVTNVAVSADATAAAPEKAADKTPAKTPAKLVAKAPVEQLSAEPRITVTFNDAHIRDVIGTFADFSKRTIVIGKAVDAVVNATIVDQPWDVAMRSILQSYGFSAFEDPNTGIISVDSYQNIAEREKVEPLVTHVISVNYAKAETMSNTVRSLLGAGCGGGAAGAAAAAAAAGPGGSTCNSRGTVSFDEKTNTVIVTETAARLADIENYVRDLDVRTPQVTIKAKIITVDRTGTEQLGIAYDLGSPNGFLNNLVTRFDGSTPVQGDFRVNLAGDALAGVANASRPYKSSAALSLIYNMTLGGFNLTSFIDALSSEQLTDIQAEPSTTTVDNKEAKLFAGSTLAFLLTPPVIPGQISTAAPQIQRQDIGITLRVTPHVTANRQILLDVFAEQQTLVDVTTAGPETNKRNSTNQVLVGDGETAVIGGLTQTQVSKNRTGIPLLMDLPGIGKLFSQQDTIERKQDLLIMITPHIVDEGEVVRPSSGKP